MEYSDQELIDLLGSDSRKAIASIFKKYYTKVVFQIHRIINNSIVAEDIAQELFLELYRKSDTLIITTSLSGYLKRMATNRTLNYIRDNRIISDDIGEVVGTLKSNQIGVEEDLASKELEVYISSTIATLPEKCKLIFTLSRYEELSYKEIAEKLAISPKTVENQISKALSILRLSLADYKKRQI